MTLRNTLSTGLLLAAVLPLPLSALGCDSTTAPAGDSQNASFGIGKADQAAGGFSACELRQALQIVNESVSSVELLEEVVGLHKRAAENIVAHRVGPDGVQGTGDDDLFDDLQELDDVYWVGPKALEALANYGAARCKEELESRPFISAKTFSGSTGGGWTRDSIELEATMNVVGLTGQKLRELLASKDARGRTGFARIRRSKRMQALSYGYPLDEIPWTSSAHQTREAMPYMAWTIESGRFDYEDGDGARELSLGTDKMDDTYYDTVNYDLLEEGMVLRGRVRWDTDTTVRRLLIAAKLDSEVDANGLKRAGKIDVRTEGGDHAATLDDDVRSGEVSWSGYTQAIEPVRVVWQTLKDAGRLKDMGGEQDVLLIDPKVHIRSLRSRYHLNYARTSDMQKVYDNGRARVAEAVAYAQAALGAGTVPQDKVAEVEALIAAGEAIADNSALLAEARDAIAQIDQALTDIVYPEDFLASAPSDWQGIEKRRLMAEAAKAVFDRFSDQLDDLDRVLTGTKGLDGDDYVDWFIDWQKGIDAGLRKRTIAKPFVQVYASLDADATTRAQAIADLNAFGTKARDEGDKHFKKFEPITEELWANLAKHLDFEALKISQRMIEAGGSMAQGLYFELAREYYVPASYRTSSNFIIDTIDYTEMMSQEEWERLPADQRTPAFELPADKVFHATLVNEVQLELTEVKEYLERIEDLEAKVAADPSDVEAKHNLDGARWVFDELQESIQRIAEEKEEDILDGLDELGAPDTADWVPAKYSKGKTALLILTDKL